MTVFLVSVLAFAVAANAALAVVVADALSPRPRSHAGMSPTARNANVPAQARLAA